MARAPIIFAICRQAEETPPPMPAMSTVSKGLSESLPNIMRQAVR